MENPRSTPMPRRLPTQRRRSRSWHLNSSSARAIVTASPCRTWNKAEKIIRATQAKTTPSPATKGLAAPEDKARPIPEASSRVEAKANPTPLLCRSTGSFGHRGVGHRSSNCGHTWSFNLEERLSSRWYPLVDTDVFTTGRTTYPVTHTSEHPCWEVPPIANSICLSF